MTGGGQGGSATQPCLFVLFPPGGRPSVADARAALSGGAVGTVCFDPSQGHSTGIAPVGDWLELVADGLTFDLLGLSPGRSLVTPEPRHRFGLAATDLEDCYAIGLAPGPHLAGAVNAMPVVRTLLRVAAALMSQWSGAIGAFWLPAGSVMRRDLFLASVEGWLDGGPFPALGLTGVVERPGGALGSDGLEFFVGQELVLDPVLGTDPIAATRLLVRLIDHLAGQGAVVGTHIMDLADGGTIRLEARGSVVNVSPVRT